MYELPFKNVTIPFKRFAAKVDCSHNAVWNLPSLKKWIDILSQLGYNSLMLYCEDTYEIDGHPYFGYGRGRYAKAELKELDTYALAHKVELIPSISALDSLPTIFRWPQYAALNDTGSILLSDNAQTYALIEGMLTTCAECFTSRVIDINMDPAPMLGRGKHQSIHGYQPIREVFDRHAEKVHALAAKLGFKAVLISEKNGSKPHRAAERWSVGDVWVRNAFNPENRYSIDQLRSQVAAAIADGTQNMIVRFFGDDGCECARFAGLPSPFWTSQTAKGIRDEAAIKNAFEETFDIAFDDFLLLDLVGNASAGEHGSHPTRYILYNGPFIGLMDLTIPDHTRVDHETLLKQLAPLCNHPEWGYLFQTLHALCAVAAAKCDVGIRFHAAYDVQDKAKLSMLAEELRQIWDLVEVFYKAFRRQWMLENKPHGFDVSNVRLGGVMTRLLHCAKRLEAYVRGEDDSIPELEDRQQDVRTPLNPDYGTRKYMTSNDVGSLLYCDIVSTNVLFKHRR